MKRVSDEACAVLFILAFGLLILMGSCGDHEYPEYQVEAGESSV